MEIRAPVCRHHLFIFSFPFSPPPSQKYEIPTTLTKKTSISLAVRRCASKRGWDSNAEGVRTGKFRFRDEAFDDDDDDDDERFRRRKKRSWWSDYQSSEFDDESDFFDDESGPLDGLWFFKVLKSYGWMLPAIIISMLIGTGPKAFLMALAIPLGQSALSLAFNKVWEATGNAPKPRSKGRRRPFSRAASTVEREEKTSGNDREVRSGFQTWVETADDVVDKGRRRRVSSFGGWDELEKRVGSTDGPARQPSQTTDRPQRSQTEKRSKLTRRRRTDVPLLIRLLIAVFPFLGSWTKFL